MQSSGGYPPMISTIERNLFSPFSLGLKAVLLAGELERLSNVFAEQWYEAEEAVRKYEEIRALMASDGAPKRGMDDHETENKILRTKLRALEEELERSHLKGRHETCDSNAVFDVVSEIRRARWKLFE
jgi:hypothetical protein